MKPFNIVSVCNLVCRCIYVKTSAIAIGAYDLLYFHSMQTEVTFQM
jgi:hypothetical protein